MSKTGIRYPYPADRSNCCLDENGGKNKGWVAKATWKLSDQVIWVLGTETISSSSNVWTAQDNAGNFLKWENSSEYRYSPHIWKGSFIPDPPWNAGMKFDWYYFSSYESSWEAPTPVRNEKYGPQKFGLMGCGRVKEFLDYGVVSLIADYIDGDGGAPQIVLCGEIGAVKRVYQEIKAAAESQSVFVNDKQPYYGQSAVGDVGVVAGTHQFKVSYQVKVKVLAEAHRRDLDAGIAHRFGKDPFKSPHFGPTVNSCHVLQYEKRMPIETQRKFKWRHIVSYTPFVGDRATYNWVGSDKGFNQQLFPPSEKIGGASARLQKVEFFFCEGCGPNEIECLDEATGRMCCVDCCQMAKWIEQGVRSINL